MFQVGDIIEATKESNIVYSITNELGECIGEIINIDLSEIKIKIIKHRVDRHIGATYWVNPKYFTSYGSNVEGFEKVWPDV